MAIFSNKEKSNNLEMEKRRKESSSSNGDGENIIRGVKRRKIPIAAPDKRTEKGRRTAGDHIFDPGHTFFANALSLILLLF